MTTTAEGGTLHPIRARSHLLQLLGEELIGDDRLAIFELVKNGYDADATTIKVDVNVNAAPAPDDEGRTEASS